MRDEVVIASNSYTNCDIRSYSSVFGKLCAIKYKDRADEEYCYQ